jgi:hypothetical protein
MPSKINGIIPSQNYELVRNRIGQILLEEFANQYDLTDDEDLNLTVAVGRSRPIAYNEMPYINVLFGRDDFDNQHQGFADGTVTFYIDCYARSKAGASNAGDVLAENKLMKMIGVSRAIIENPAYKTLDFTPGKIMHRSITNFAISDQKDDGNGAVTVMGRMTLSVRMDETTALIDADLIGEHTTQVKLGQTEQGYVWSGESSPIDTCEILINGLSESQLNQCILPSYDFSDDIVLVNLTNQQRIDLTAEFGGGGGSYTYNVLIDGVDTGEDVTIDGTDVTINLI